MFALVLASIERRPIDITHHRSAVRVATRKSQRVRGIRIDSKLHIRAIIHHICRSRAGVQRELSAAASLRALQRAAQICDCIERAAGIAAQPQRYCDIRIASC